MNPSMRPADAAILAACAESMFDANAQTMPALDPRVADRYEIVGYLSARNALFGTQKLGLGDQVYFGFIARSRTIQRDYVVVVRGTELPIEWFEDAELTFVRGPGHSLVEQGFWSIYSSMLLMLGGNVTAAPAAAGIIALLGGVDYASVTFIGHSLAGPLGSYLMCDVAAWAKQHAAMLDVYGMFFASPKPGDAQFGRTFELSVGQDNYKVYNYTRDFVPRLPPSLPFGLGFQHLPSVQWIRPSDSTVKIPNGLESNHAALNYAALLGADISTATPTVTGSAL